MSESTLQRLARRVLTDAHPDREVEKEWADELARAVLLHLYPDMETDFDTYGDGEHDDQGRST